MKLLDALHGVNRGRPPVWLMRQAGRYMPEYQEIRSRHSTWELFHNAKLGAEITKMAIDLFGFDAAILFSDILVALEAMGFEVHYEDGKAPFVTQGSKTSSLDYVYETIDRLQGNLGVPLLGFAGAPFTLATYVFETGNRTDLPLSKEKLYSDPMGMHSFLGEITEVVIAHLQGQISAGVDAVQVFDSWAGALSRQDFLEFSLPYLERIARAIEVPKIIFMRGSSQFASELASVGFDAISLDPHADLPAMRRELGDGITLQGNLDPHFLKYAPVDAVIARTSELLESMKGDPAFIFNLGHGVLPKTPVENVRALVATTKQVEASSRGSLSGSLQT